MGRVQVRFETDHIPNKLEEVRRKKGYNSREEFLREQLERIAYDDVIMESESRYLSLLQRHEEVMSFVSSTLMLNVELGLLKSPFEMENKGGENDGEI